MTKQQSFKHTKSRTANCVLSLLKILLNNIIYFTFLTQGYSLEQSRTQYFRGLSLTYQWCLAYFQTSQLVGSTILCPAHRKWFVHVQKLLYKYPTTWSHTNLYRSLLAVLYIMRLHQQLGMVQFSMACLLFVV